MFSPDTVLSWATFAPLLGAGVIVVLVAIRSLLGLPKRVADDGARLLALVASGVSLGAAIAAWRMFDGTTTQVQLVQHFTWIESFNIEYYLGVDGL